METVLEFVKNCDKETLDILHDLELEYKWYDIITAYKTILKITHIRRQRRKAKDKIEVITDLEEGDVLEAGECIGTVAEPTRYYVVEGPNLYFKVMEGEESIDPAELLKNE